MEKIGQCYGCENSSEKSRYAGCKDKAETQSGGTPRSHTMRTRNQMAEATLKSAAAWFLFHFTSTRAANIIDKRCAQNAGNSVPGDDTAQLMRGYSQ